MALTRRRCGHSRGQTDCADQHLLVSTQATGVVPSGAYSTSACGASSRQVSRSWQPGHTLSSAATWSRCTRSRRVASFLGTWRQGISQDISPEACIQSRCVRDGSQFLGASPSCSARPCA